MSVFLLLFLLPYLAAVNHPLFISLPISLSVESFLFSCCLSLSLTAFFPHSFFFPICLSAIEPLARLLLLFHIYRRLEEDDADTAVQFTQFLSKYLHSENNNNNNHNHNNPSQNVETQGVKQFAMFLFSEQGFVQGIVSVALRAKVRRQQRGIFLLFFYCLFLSFSFAIIVVAFSDYVFLSFCYFWDYFLCWLCSFAGFFLFVCFFFWFLTANDLLSFHRT